MAAWDEPRGSRVSEGMMTTVVLVVLVLAAAGAGAYVVYRILASVTGALG